MKQFTWLVIGMSGIFSLLSSCRNPPQGSRLQTLDNIGVRSGAFEACEGAGQTHPKAQLGSEPHLRSALAAVPYKIQKSFFDDFGGRIRVSKSNECGLESSRQDDALGCWKRLADSKQSLEIIIKRTTKAKEQYALVRTFGFVYGDLILTRVIPGNPSAPVKINSRFDAGLGVNKTHLASVFLGELYAALAQNERDELTDVLGDLGISKEIISEKSFERRHQMFTKIPLKTQEAFASRVFAEAFHSQFCTQKSAQKACSLYPETMNLFAPYAADVTTQKELSRTQCASDASKKASATHLEWYSLNESALLQREKRGRDNGAQLNARIAAAVQQKVGPQRTASGDIANKAEGFSLNSDFIQQLLGLITGGISGGDGGGGLGGLLSQLLGGVDTSGLGGLGNLGGLLSNLGLGDLLSDGSGIVDNLNNDNSDNVQPNVTPNNTDPLPSGGNATAEEQAGMDATNRYRQSQGKSVLQIDQQMVEDCRKQAQLQAQKGGLTHYLYPAGVSRAENIAYGSKSGEYTVMQQWVKSPGHHRNIMGNHRFIGIGNYGNQWCQRFR